MTNPIRTEDGAKGHINLSHKLCVMYLHTLHLPFIHHLNSLSHDYIKHTYTSILVITNDLVSEIQFVITQKKPEIRYLETRGNFFF